MNVKSGLPATTSTERLELLDDEEHILGIKIVGGDHRLRVSTLVSLLDVLRFAFVVVHLYECRLLYCEL